MTSPHLSIILPCLNEARSLPSWISELKNALRKEHVSAEILVCDNASEDGSATVARRFGARVVTEPRRGYGHASWQGIVHARAPYLVLVDADATYDARDVIAVYRELREGWEFVLGDRLNGSPERGAMPWLHRRVGTPLVALAIRAVHGGSFHDPNCGLRGFCRSIADDIAPVSGGMESASEMVLRVLRKGFRSKEIPIRYRPRRWGRSKLRSFRDGLRHLLLILSEALPRDR